MHKGKIINDEVSLKRLAKRMSKLEEFAFDTETNTLKVNGPNDGFILVGMSISWGKYHTYYIPTGHYFDDCLSVYTLVKALKPIFENPNIRLIGHNIKYDLHVLARCGIHIKTRDLFDTMCASAMINENESKGLKENTERWFNSGQRHMKDVLTTVTAEEKKSVGLKASQKPGFELVRIENGAPYALDDAFYTWELYLMYSQMLIDEGLDKIFYKMYPDFLFTLYTMEERGIAIDLEHLEQMDKDITEDLSNLNYKLFEILGAEFNPSSNQQLAEILFGEYECKNPNENLLNLSFGFPVTNRTPKGNPQVNEDSLKHILDRHYKTRRKLEGLEFCEALIEYSKLTKLKTAFIDGIRANMYDDGMIHTNYNPVGTTSGRISSNSPNLQQLPNAKDDAKYQIRSLFIGLQDEDSDERDIIIAIDYDNLEMKITAHFSEDKILLETFRLRHDSHGSTAVVMFNLPCEPDQVKELYEELRQVAKTINFLLIYGGGAFALYQQLTSEGVDLDSQAIEKGLKDGKELAQQYIDTYFEKYSGVAKFMKDQKRFAHKHEYVYTLVGRKRHLFNINSNDFRQVAYEERLALNSPIQGSAADIIINAQNKIEKDEKLKRLKCKMLLQVHDELVFSCPASTADEAIEILKEYMQNPFGKNTQLNVDLTVTAGKGYSYQEAK